MRRRIVGKQPPPAGNDLLEVWRDLNRPGAAKFAAELRKRGIPFSADDAKAVIEAEGSRQLFREPPRYRGAVTATRKDERWAMDILSFDRPSTEGVSQILLVQDVFTRFAWGEPLTDRDASAAFSAIVGRSGNRPDVLTTDKDPNFDNAGFKETVEKLGVQSLVFAEGRNDIATVDRLMGTLEEALEKEKVDAKRSDWNLAMFRRVLANYNKSKHSTLAGAAPKDVAGNADLTFFLHQRNLENRTSNDDQRGGIAGRLRELGAFRIFVRRRARLRRRRDEQIWSDEVHRVRSIDERKGQVTDTEGVVFPIREVLPVSVYSQDVSRAAPTRFTPAEERRRQALQRFAEEAEVFLQGRPDRSAFTRTVAGALDMTGLRAALKSVNTSLEAPIARLARTFPEKFRLETARGGGTSKLVLET